MRGNTYQKTKYLYSFQKKESVINIVFVQQTKFLSFLYKTFEVYLFFFFFLRLKKKGPSLY